MEIPPLIKIISVDFADVDVKKGEIIYKLNFHKIARCYRKQLLLLPVQKSSQQPFS